MLLIAMICSAIIIEVGNCNAHWHWVGACDIDSHKKGQKNTLIGDKPLLFQIFGEQILENLNIEGVRGGRSM
jgi:hypothetical protein